MPHNLETLCLCYVNQTHSEVPILSSNRDTIQKGGETTFSFPRSSLPRCRVIITQREVLTDRVSVPMPTLSSQHGRRWEIPFRLLEAWGQDPCLQRRLLVGRQEESRTGQFIIQRMQVSIRYSQELLLAKSTY